MSVLFIDTNSEIPFKVAKDLKIENIIRMPYTICGEEHFYDLGEHTDLKHFFDLIRAGNMPITSGLNAEMYKEYFEPFFALGEDILYVSFGTNFSGTFKYLETAIDELKAKYPKAKYQRYDTKAISIGTAMQVYVAAQLYNEGKSNDEIIAVLTNLTQHINVIATPDDLNFLKRGGRLSGVQAALGTLMQVKPILKLTQKGTLINAAKVNGRKKALLTLINDVISRIDETQLEKYPVIMINADCQPDADFIISKLKEKFPTINIWDCQVGPVIGTHCGPNTIAITYYGDLREIEG